MLQTRLQNAAEHDPALDGQFDAVIADVPCSGLGVIRKKPDIRYKLWSRWRGCRSFSVRSWRTSAAM